MKNRIAWALVAALALWATAVGGQTIGADGVKAQSLGYTRVGGITGADSIGRLLKMDASGNVKVIDADRPEDRSPLTNLLTSSVAANTVLATNVFDASQYTSFQIHVSWSVGTTLADTSKCDSVAFLIIPFGRTTLLDSGDNYIISQASVVGGITDTTLGQLNRTLPGILVTPRKHPFATNPTVIGGYRPERIVWADFGAAKGLGIGGWIPPLQALEGNYKLDKAVSFPLGGSAYGGDVKELFLGFYVVNLSKATGATSFSLDVIPKVN